MRYAIVNNQRAESTPGATGTCPTCHSPVIAKCGDLRVHHWAHRSKKVCDRWREPMTAWHYGWQDKFPKDWQEVTRLGEAAEQHRADVYTDRGLVIEVQHSSLRADEMAARERFYRNMVWVVNGARVRGDLRRFLKVIRLFPPPWGRAFYVVPTPEKIFPQAWLNNRAPVFFDFDTGWKLTEATQPVVRPLWCLLPGRVFRKAVVACISRAAFVRRANERPQVLAVSEIMRRIEARLAPHEREKYLAAKLRARQTSSSHQVAAAFAQIQRRARRTPRMP